jgi:predicted transcriptional regulator
VEESFVRVVTLKMFLGKLKRKNKDLNSSSYQVHEYGYKALKDAFTIQINPN